MTAGDAQPPIANVEQATAWAGADGDHWTQHADVYEAAARRYDEHLFAAAAIDAADRVLDVGCGSGATTREAARRASAGSALGIDLSPQMLELARARAAAEGLANATFVMGDAQVHPFEPGAFDVLVSRNGAMFFADPVAGFTNLAAATRPGGRLALVSWRGLADNVWLRAIRGALAAGRDLPEPPSRGPSPFGLSEPAHVKDVLTAAGFGAVELTPVDEPMTFGKTAADAFGFWSTAGIARGLLADLDDAARAAALDTLRALLEAHETPEGVVFDSASWVITAQRG